MRILVTGGAGFIGANFIYHQLAHYPEDVLLCLDKLTYAGNAATLKRAMDRGVELVRGDIADPETVFPLFESFRPQWVVNFAAESHVDRSIHDPGIFVHTNVQGVQVLLDACRSYGVERFHQISTDEVYGDLPLDRPELSFDEETPLCPSSPYAASKAAADLLVQSYIRTYGLPATLSRASNNYGPYQFPEKLIPLMILRGLAGQPLPIYGTGANVRDWLYVEDHCRAVEAILRRGKVGQIYNIGGGCERANLEVVRAILDRLDRPESLITFMEDRPGHDLRYSLNIEKAARELDWRPAVPFEEGLRHTVEWYLAHPDWWQNIQSGAYQEKNSQIPPFRSI